MTSRYRKQDKERANYLRLKNRKLSQVIKSVNRITFGDVKEYDDVKDASFYFDMHVQDLFDAHNVLIKRFYSTRGVTLKATMEDGSKLLCIGNMPGGADLILYDLLYGDDPIQ